MTSDEAVLKVIDALDAVPLPYMLVGSFASNFYGIPRATQDADFVMQLGTAPISSVMNHLDASFRLEPQMSFETVTGTIRYIVQVADIPFTIELFLLSQDPYDVERFRRRCRVSILNRETWVPTVEDVVVTKLRWSRQGQRPKDVEDVRNVIAVQREYVDWEYVYHWCDVHGTRDVLEKICNSFS